MAGSHWDLAATRRRYYEDMKRDYKDITAFRIKLARLLNSTQNKKK